MTKQCNTCSYLRFKIFKGDDNVHCKGCNSEGNEFNNFDEASDERKADLIEKARSSGASDEKLEELKLLLDPTYTREEADHIMKEELEYEYDRYIEEERSRTFD